MKILLDVENRPVSLVSSSTVGSCRGRSPKLKIRLAPCSGSAFNLNTPTTYSEFGDSLSMAWTSKLRENTNRASSLPLPFCRTRSLKITVGLMLFAL